MNYTTIKHTITIGEVLRYYGFPAPYRDTYRMPCMLHGGEGSNFSVSEPKGVYHCFTCNASGSVIDLVATLEGIDIKEAAHKLNSDFNLSLAQASVAEARALSSKIKRYNVYRDS